MTIIDTSTKGVTITPIEQLHSDVVLLRAQLVALKRDLQFSIDILFSNSNQYIDTAVSFAERLDKLEAFMYGNCVYTNSPKIGVLQRLEKLEIKR